MALLDSSTVEHPAVNRRVAGSNPARSQYFGPIAQLVEPPAHNRLVPGSSPGRPTIKDVTEVRDWGSCQVFKKDLTERLRVHTIIMVRFPDHAPVSDFMWPHGQAVKTPAFHAGIRGSNPLGVTNQGD